MESKFYGYQVVVGLIKLIELLASYHLVPPLPTVINGCQFGYLWYFAYEIKDNPVDHVIIATTKHETMFGDVALAIHPDDKRYTKYHVKYVKHPFLNEIYRLYWMESWWTRNLGQG